MRHHWRPILRERGFRGRALREKIITGVVPDHTRVQGVSAVVTKKNRTEERTQH